MAVRRFKKGTYNSYFKKKMSRRGGKSSRRGGRASLRATVTSVLMKKAETKYYDIGIENVQLYHNCGTTQLLFPGFVRSIFEWFNPWQQIGQSTSRSGRIGDKITPRGMKIDLYIANKQDRPNTMIRVIVAILPKVIQGVITIPRFDPFQIANSGVNGNVMVQPADSERGVKFLYDKVHRMTNTQTPFNSAGGGGAKEMTKHLKLWIKRKGGPIIFDQGGADIIGKPLAVYVIPYEQYSTLNTDNVASCAGHMRMYYKDF